MKTHLLLIFCLIAGYFVNAQSVKDERVRFTKNNEYDVYNRIIKNEDGKKINYPIQKAEALYADTARFNRHKNADFLAGSVTQCDPAWKFSIMGTYIGRKSMQSVDLDGDGKIEVICSAKAGYNYDFTGDYWYILQYDAVKNTYYQQYTSDPYAKQIRRMKVLDVNNDGKPEILAGFENGEIKVYNGLTKSEIAAFALPVQININDLELGDADNDGIKELVISTDEKIYLYRTSNFTVKSQIDFGAAEFALGNVDGDTDIEIVTTKGKVLSYKGSAVTTEWTFDSGSGSDGYYMVELSDIDSDGKKEIVLAKSWQYIDVYDADIKALKFEVLTELDIQALLLQDVNNDNIDEIIYGDGQWGEVHCINSASNTEMWKVVNPEHGVTALSISDADNDGKQEVMWGAGWTSSGADYFYVADIATRTIEWQSADIVGPFYATAIDDIDNDGIKEIVAISYESESGYGSGILLVFSAVTHELEWQSDGNFFYLVWTGIYDLAIKDIDNDGQKEIIVAAGETYTGQIWIVNGITKTIESTHIFNSEDIDEFYAVEVEDIDDDGNQEIVVMTSNFYYIINPVDYSIKYTSGSLQGSYNTPVLRIANIDSSAEKEIVILSSSKIQVFGGITHTQWISPASDYTSIELYDINGDGKKDIVAGKADGTVVAFDGSTHETLQSFKLISKRIDGIVVSDLNNDASPEYIFTSEGTVYIYADSNQYMLTRRFGGTAGSYNSLQVADVNNDSKKEIIFGSTTSIIELSENCYSCMWLHATKSTLNVSCGGLNDGSVNIVPAGGAEPYTYLWNTGGTGAGLSNLAPGLYIVTVTDGAGCTLVDSTNIKQSKLSADFVATNETCVPSHDGTASLIITEGTPPYLYNWNNGQHTSSISNLDSGNYSVLISDSRNCTANFNINIGSDTLILALQVVNPYCHGSHNGYINVYPYSGTAPFNYLWNTGQVSPQLYDLFPGTYSVIVTDSHGCAAAGSGTLVEPDPILTQTSSTPDNPVTVFGEGTATVNAIGGFPPYHVYWSDPFMQTTITAVNLLAGKYSVRVSDNKGCQTIDSVEVTNTYGIAETSAGKDFGLYPNPTKGLLFLDFKSTALHTVELWVYNSAGILVYYSPKTNIQPGVLSVDLTSLPTGIYGIILKSDKEVMNRKLF